MKIKHIDFDDMKKYKKSCMTIYTPFCLYSNRIQNNNYLLTQTINMDDNKIIKQYKESNCEAICINGLEPFDSFEELCTFILHCRGARINDDIVIYTNYNLTEIEAKISELYKISKDFSGEIIVKFGEYRKDLPPRIDETLGVEVSSKNQFAIRLSKLFKIISI